MSVVEGTFHTRDGVKLFTKTWNAEGTPKARLVFLHGFSDHIDAQGRFFPLLAKKGITVFAFDQRGWGKSAATKADRGKSGGTPQIMSDITSFIKSLPMIEDQPLFLMGHSMGGNEVLYYLATGPNETLSMLRGVLAESPLLDITPVSRPVPGLETVGRFVAKFLPSMQMVQKLDVNLVSRDREVTEAMKKDPLVHQTGTLEGFEAMLTRMRELSSGKVTIEPGKLQGGKTRLIVFHGDADGICWYDASKKFMDEQVKVEDQQFKTYNGWYHKLHDDGTAADKELFAKDVADWILERI